MYQLNEDLPALEPIDIAAMEPTKLLWCWCEIEELLGTRGATFPGRCSSQGTAGGLDTRIHDWVERQLAAHQKMSRLQSINLYRLVRKKVWGDVGELRFCDSPSEQQAFDRALRCLGHSRESLVDLLFDRLCAFLATRAKEDGAV